MNAATLSPPEISRSCPSPDSASPPPGISREEPTSITPNPSRRATAALLLNPALQAVATIDHCQPLGNTDTDFAHVFEELEAITAAVTSGDMKHPEGIAIAQATALNIMFGKLSGLALSNIQTPNFDSLMRLALRAQSQSGRTLETLATLRNPAIFANQVNVANQQIVANAPIPTPPDTSDPPLPSSPAPAALPDEAPNPVRLANKKNFLPRFCPPPCLKPSSFGRKKIFPDFSLITHHSSRPLITDY